MKILMEALLVTTFGLAGLFFVFTGLGNKELVPVVIGWALLVVANFVLALYREDGK